jgi:hypothetical protein
MRFKSTDKGKRTFSAPNPATKRGAPSRSGKEISGPKASIPYQLRADGGDCVAEVFDNVGLRLVSCVVADDFRAEFASREVATGESGEVATGESGEVATGEAGEVATGEAGEVVTGEAGEVASPVVSVEGSKNALSWDFGAMTSAN